ncbi:MAG: phosphatidylglycerophosphatase A [Chlorobiaceae bacterium]|nr:phosphatidylglycerophosphatase A [Chlorobiaceae bacterium]
MRQLFAKIAGSAFGLGYAPFAPGTVASAAAALAYFFIPALHDPLVLLPLIVATTALGVWSSSVMEEEYGEDPSQAVIDEVAGQWLALAFLPVTPFVVLLGFVLFRVFDILKPGPVDSAQRLPSGWGIMSDDVLAGIFANVTLRVLMFALPMLPFGAAL